MNRNDVSENETPYLVRGVSWSQPPLFSIVAYDRATLALHVQQYTYSGEIFIPGKRMSSASPMIVILSGHLEAVFPDAILGGDRIAGLSYSEKAWRER